MRYLRVMAQWKKIRQDQFIISFFSNNEEKKNTEYPLTLTSVHFSSATRLCAAHSEQDASVLTFSFFFFFWEILLERSKIAKSLVKLELVFFTEYHKNPYSCGGCKLLSRTEIKFMPRLQNTHKRSALRFTSRNFPEWSMASPPQRERWDGLNRQPTALRQQAAILSEPWRGPL